MHESRLLNLFVFNQPKKCFQKGKKEIRFGKFRFSYGYKN